MKHILNITRVAIALIIGAVSAQQETNYSLYRYTMNAINPAYAGSNSERVEFTTHAKTFWRGINGAPETQTFNLTAPLTDRLGLGLSVINDKVFIETETDIFIDLSYRLQLAEKTNLYLGVKIGGSTYKLDPYKLSGFNVAFDPALWNVENQFRPNFGIGAYLKRDNYFVSLSIPKLFNSRALINNPSDAIIYSKGVMHTYLSGGYNFKLSGIEFKPSFMAIYTQGAPLSVDFTAAAQIIDPLEVGFSYRTDRAFSGLLKLDVFDWMSVGYAYETSTRNEIIKVSNGSHEFLLCLKL
jgi:type IX secretion system PorP/SprF family membrane protein